MSIFWNKGHGIIFNDANRIYATQLNFYAYNKPWGLLIDEILSRSLNDDIYVQSSPDQTTETKLSALQVRKLTLYYIELQSVKTLID
jgi:hypothetical protein